MVICYQTLNRMHEANLTKYLTYFCELNDQQSTHNSK